MSLILRDPFRELDQFHDRLSEIFSKTPVGANTEAMLPINVYEQDNQLKIDAMVPDFAPDEVDIDITKNNIEIRVEHKEETQEQNKKYYHKESSYKSLYRRIAIPDTADTDNAKANQKNGVLKITTPLAQEKQSKKLEIESGD